MISEIINQLESVIHKLKEHDIETPTKPECPKDYLKQPNIIGVIVLYDGSKYMFDGNKWNIHLPVGAWKIVERTTIPTVVLNMVNEATIKYRGTRARF